MKVSKKEVEAALTAWNASNFETFEEDMRAALIAAYTVRKARKAERGTHHNLFRQFNIGDRVVSATFGSGTVVKVYKSDTSHPYKVKFDSGVYGRSLTRDLTPAPPEDRWIEWSGGDCPVPGSTRVDIRLRNNRHKSCDNYPARGYDWQHRNIDGDIVAYRIRT